MLQPSDERVVIRQFRHGDHHAFKILYERYAPKLYAFAKKYLQDGEASEEIVQEVFLRIWERRSYVDETGSFSAYVFQAAKNRIFNGFRKKINEQAYLDHLLATEDSGQNLTEIQVDYREVKFKAEAAIRAMPPKRQEIFRLSREAGLKNQEIADKLGISIKTVENQMGQALKFLREQLSDYNSLILLILLTQFFYQNSTM